MRSESTQAKPLNAFKAASLNPVTPLHAIPTTKPATFSKLHLKLKHSVCLWKAQRSSSNGVVIATEKKLPSILVDEASVQKIQHLTPNIGVVYSGMGPDFRVLVRKSRKQAEQYLRLYKEPIPVTQLVRETATVMQEFTQSGFEGEISSKNIEIGKIGADKVFRVLTPAEIDDYLAEVE
ncbi:hypothetical protein Bca52824_053343 [Brassica carinata]|uniref:Uncharacterized protein n=1 Tax=Brassica carinata TaxID=52824 RepID=A0A8X7R8S4_BRACI|nr:hypothetical protein Bca52824_053343 [Brassica carinata]